jgi:hypothetical protein
MIVACVLALLLVVTTVRGADFESDWLYEDLTCAELASGYGYNVVVLKQLLFTHDNCLHYADSPADTGFGHLHCALLKKEGLFVQGVINDLVAVFKAKRCGKK